MRASLSNDYCLEYFWRRCNRRRLQIILDLRFNRLWYLSAERVGEFGEICLGFDNQNLCCTFSKIDTKFVYTKLEIVFVGRCNSSQKFLLVQETLIYTCREYQMTVGFLGSSQSNVDATIAIKTNNVLSLLYVQFDVVLRVAQVWRFFLLR